MVIIATIAAMAVPQLLPTIIYSTHEGAARHLANYGRSAIAFVVLNQETITVKIDLDLQEYWCERMPEPEPPEETDALAQDAAEEFPDSDMELYWRAREELDRPEDERGSKEGDRLMAEQTRRMTDQFSTRSRRALRARASRVTHDQKGILDGVGDLFEDEFNLDGNGEEILPEEVRDPLLTRSRLPESVYIEYVRIGDREHHEGIVEIVLSPLGLATDVTFSLINEEGDLFTVTWDPLTGNAAIFEGGTS